ncbi:MULTISPECIES: hypothetical protein [Paenibacillus]|uniref:Sporulation lipoprotein YhcN/YlaJ (Spore_YhcN_YlaJ) n=1 Tax=Paenibacillus alvei TaxID=44250 RepID=A0ABT4EH97_PAEAL|nr:MULTISPECIES: hypothetical protein [Paenibacillus]EPY10826.1 hypothetical protein PAAL66ix_21287 [Paenibacillus alvei A6-6i-x]MCY9532013.1 hypothetical protein [Paenibacillus alvei]SDF30982.1 hypothetical protein SAMN04488689_104273 [Paenibacillus sp. cl6col]
MELSNDVHNNANHVHWIVTFIIAAVMLVSSGCAGMEAEKSRSPGGNTKANYADRKVKEQSAPSGTPLPQMGTESNHRTKQNTMQSHSTSQPQALSNPRPLFINQSVSDAVGHLDGVSVAYVLQHKDTAYVALTLDGTGLGTIGSGGKHEQSRIGAPNTAGHMEREANRWPPRFITSDSPVRTVKQSDKLSDELLHTIDKTVRSQTSGVKHVRISANMDLFNGLTPYVMHAYPGDSLQFAEADIMKLIHRTMH